MAEVLFYHLEHTKLDHVLPKLLEKSLEKEWRCEVRTEQKEHAEHLDQWLWTYKVPSFLPHGRLSDKHQAQIPILITHSEENPEIKADVIFLVGGADHALTGDYVRFIYIFAGQDQEAVQRARKAWKRAKSHDHEVSYWRQSPQGRWEKQG